jgi:D-glycero-D-manno-heptose 1,7-bisphosphate phosphatase
MVYNPEYGIVDSPSNPEQFELLSGVGKAVKLMNEMDMLVILISNQPGIAKEKYTHQILDAINQKMQKELAKYGAHLDAIYYCLHHPDAVLEEYRIVCNCRKPKPGLLEKASKEHNIQLESSYMIGDGLTDIQAGKAAGCKTIFLGQQKCYVCQRMEALNAKPDFIVSDLLEAVKLIQKTELLE